jgi:hypothetical protein
VVVDVPVPPLAISGYHAMAVLGALIAVGGRSHAPSGAAAAAGASARTAAAIAVSVITARRAAFIQ